MRGVEQKVFLKIKDTITTHNTEQVNLNTAGYSVLYALGLSDGLSKRIVEFRQGKDGVSGTEDDNIFKSPEELRNIDFLFTEESIQINKLLSNNLLTVNSEVFRINSSGIIGDLKRMHKTKIVCVVKIQEKREPQILYWHET